MLLCPLTALLDKNHTEWVTEVFIQCDPEDNAREGRTSSAGNQGARDWDRAAGPGKKAGAYLHNGLKGSRLEQAHEIRPNVFAITTTTGYNTSCTGVPGEVKRREVELDPQASPEEIVSMEVELGCESWTSFVSGWSSTAVRRTLSLWLCPC